MDEEQKNTYHVAALIIRNIKNAVNKNDLNKMYHFNDGFILGLKHANALPDKALLKLSKYNFYLYLNRKVK